MKLDGYAPRPQFSDISFLTHHFPLKQVHVVEDLGGTYNLNLLLDMEQGAYVLRLYRSWVTPERLSQIQQVKRLLSRSDFPVSLPIPTCTGETILLYDNHLMEIEPFITHDGIADTKERNVKAFALLGKLHTFFSTETSRITLVDPVVSNYGTPEMLLTWTQQVLEEVGQSRQHLHAPERQHALTLYAEAIDILSSLHVFLYTGLPRRIFYRTQCIRLSNKQGKSQMHVGY